MLRGERSAIATTAAEAATKTPRATAVILAAVLRFSGFMALFVALGPVVVVAVSGLVIITLLLFLFVNDI